MSVITLQTIPGFSDLSDASLAANDLSLGVLLSRINVNAAFGMVRLEVFVGTYGNGDTVPLPTSPVDGYTYARNELMYVWAVANTANKSTGWASYREPWTMWYGIWSVDQSSGAVASEIGYRGNNDHKNETATTNDGVIQVFTIAQRQKTGLIMSASPSFTGHVATDFYVNEALHTGLLTDINHDAKFSVANTEVIYMGEFFNGQTVPQPVSPIDGHTYPYANVQFMTSMRFTADTDGNGNPIKPAISEGQLQDWSASVNASTGAVSTSVVYELNGRHTTTNGKCAVFAFCTRPLGATFSTVQTSFSEIVDSTFQPGATLRASTMQQLNKNIGQAVCSPEFFGPTLYSNGNTVPVPTSALDGYTYARSELVYIWDWANTGPSVASSGRLSVVHGSVDPNTGAVTVLDYRLDSGASSVALVHEGQLRVTVMARRASNNVVSAINPPTQPVDSITEYFGWLDDIPDGVNTGKVPLGLFGADGNTSGFLALGNNLVMNGEFSLTTPPTGVQSKYASSIRINDVDNGGTQQKTPNCWTRNFESAGNGEGKIWQYNGGGFVSAGSYMMILSDAPGKTNCMFASVSDAFPVTPGRAYKVYGSFYVGYGTGLPAHGNWYFRVFFYKQGITDFSRSVASLSANIPTGTTSGFTGSGGAFAGCYNVVGGSTASGIQKATCTVNAPSDAAYARIALYKYGDGTDPGSQWNLAVGDIRMLPITVDGEAVFNISTLLNGQGSLVPNQTFTLNYTFTDTSISLSWSSASLLRPDGSTLTVASGSQNYTGLTASTKYYIYGYLNVNTGAVGFTNGSPPPSGSSGNATMSAQTALDGRSPLVPISIITASTGGSGSGSGGDGGTCPEENELVDIQGKGNVRAEDTDAGQYVLGFSFKKNADVYRRIISKTYRSCAAWQIVDGYKVTRCETVHKDGQWISAYRVPGSVFDGTVSYCIEIVVEADEGDEHNFWLVGRAGRLLIHNFVLDRC